MKDGVDELEALKGLASKRFDGYPELFFSGEQLGTLPDDRCLRAAFACPKESAASED